MYLKGVRALLRPFYIIFGYKKIRKMLLAVGLNPVPATSAKR